MSIDPGALARLRVRIEEVLGVDDTAALLDPLTRVRWDRLVTIDDLEPFATKADLERFATKADLERFATKADLQGFATKADLEGFATKADLQGFATKADLEGFATKADLEPFATKADLERFATKEEVVSEVRQCELRLRALLEQRLGEFQSQIRRDLLLVTGGQFFTLVAAVAAVLGFG